jgi:hypothetical protein
VRNYPPPSCRPKRASGTGDPRRGRCWHHHRNCLHSSRGPVHRQGGGEGYSPPPVVSSSSGHPANTSIAQAASTAPIIFPFFLFIFTPYQKYSRYFRLQGSPRADTALTDSIAHPVLNIKKKVKKVLKKVCFFHGGLKQTRYPHSKKSGELIIENLNG